MVLGRASPEYVELISEITFYGDNGDGFDLLLGFFIAPPRS